MDPVEDFAIDSDGGQVTFFTDGSIDLAGKVYFRDERDNYLRLALSPRATGHVEITKYDPDGAQPEDRWVLPGKDGKPWTWN